MKQTVFLIIFLSSLLFLSSCLEREDFPLEPRIELISFTPYQDTDSATLILGFTDGDGDIGLRSDEENPPYNMFMQYHEKQNGVFVEVIPTIPFNYRLPIINEAGKPRPLQGEIEIGVSFFYDLTSPYDTIKYSMYIVDRAGNMSNTVETDEIIVNKD